MRKRIERGLTHAKWAKSAFVARAEIARSLLGAAFDARLCPWLDETVGQFFADESAGAGPPLQITFMEELFVRHQHRKSRDAELDGECTRRRDPLARSKQSLEDCAAQSIVELPMNCDRSALADGQERKDLRSAARFHVDARDVVIRTDTSLIDADF
jgi:hypothetical protein